MGKKKSRKTKTAQATMSQGANYLGWLASRNGQWVALMAIVVFGASLRLYDSLNPVMWFDEIVTIERSGGQFGKGIESEFFQLDKFNDRPINPSSIETSKPISEVWAIHAEGDLHPPLHSTILHFQRKLWGDSFLSVRIPSLLPSIASIILIFFITKMLLGLCAAYWASILMALAAPQVLYGQEIRGYALLTFVGLFAVYFLLKTETSGPSILRSAWLGFFSFALALTHYFSFGLLLAMGLYAALRLRGKALAYALSGFAFGGILFLAVWGPQMWNQFFGPSLEANKYDTFRQNPELAKQIPGLVAGWFERLFFHLPNDFITRPPVVLFLCLLPAVAIFWKRNLLLPWLWMVCTMGFVALLDMNRDTFHFTQIRYTLLAAPAVYMIVSAGVFNGKRQAVYNSVLPAILSILLIFNIPKIHTPYKERWVEIADLIQKKGQPNETVVLPHAGESFQLYWPQFIWSAICYYIFDPQRPVVIPTKPLGNDLMSKIGWGKDAWVITRVPDFQGALSMDWPSKWLPGCVVKEAWVAQAGASVFHVRLPQGPQQ
jgi:uncharacterized membrane protein